MLWQKVYSSFLIQIFKMSHNTLEPLQTGIPENQKPLETEQICWS